MPIGFSSATQYEKIELELKNAGKVWTTYKVLDPRSIGMVGVGTPFIIRDLDTYQPYMFFTAWNDITGKQRSIYVGQIDEDLHIHNIKLVASPSLFNVQGLNTVSLVWDDYNEEWILASGIYGSATNQIALMFLDKDFNVKYTQTWSFTLATGSNLLIGDAGCSMFTLGNKIALITTGWGSFRSIYYVNDITVRPLPTPTQLNASGTKFFWWAPTYYNGALDVHHTFLSNNGIIMLSELLHNRNTWWIHVYYGADRDLYVRNMLIPFKLVTPIKPLIPIQFADILGNIGHPHYTNYLGRPLLFFARFPTWNLGGKRAYAHEIWATDVDTDIFNPTGKTMIVNNDNDIYTMPDIIPIPTFGAKYATITLFNISGSGTLNVWEANSPYHLWAQTENRFQNTFTLSSSYFKTTIENVAPWISLGTNVNIGMYQVILYF